MWTCSECKKVIMMGRGAMYFRDKATKGYPERMEDVEIWIACDQCWGDRSCYYQDLSQFVDPKLAKQTIDHISKKRWCSEENKKKMWWFRDHSVGEEANTDHH